MDIKYINRSTGKVEIEKPPAEGMLKFLYDNPFGKSLFLPLIKRKFITELYGRMMNKKSSTNRIKKFVDDLNIDMTEYKKRMDEFTSFNDFFFRELKSNARKLEENIISPGDGKILAFENINEVNTFFVKGRQFTLSEFLNSEVLAKRYNNGSMVILRLAPNDYHRYHFPFDGIPTKSEEIKGDYYSVSPYALVSNFTKVFCENKREICKFTLPNDQVMLLIPVGATMVGNIISTYEPNQMVNKGDEMGYFAFGGSTVVLLFQSNNIKINSDLLKNTKSNMETFVRMGEQIAEFV